jgi:hypothetical protein
VKTSGRSADAAVSFNCLLGLHCKDRRVSSGKEPDKELNSLEKMWRPWH